MESRRRWMVPVLGIAVMTMTGLGVAQDNSSANGNQSQASGKSSQQAENGSKLSAKDKLFMKKAAEGGLEEVELGQMVQQKAKSQDVKDFAKRMVDDHTKANDELKSLAEKEGYTLPTTMSPNGKSLKAKLEKLSGEQLDRSYMTHMVADHTKDVAEFRAESKTGNDPDVKSWAGQTLSTLESHLQEAKQVAAKEKKENNSNAKNSKSSGSTTAQQ